MIDVIEKQNLFNIVGLICGFKDPSTEVGGYKVLGAETILANPIYEHVRYGIVAVGDNWVRNQIVKKITLLKPAFKFVTAVHPSVNIAKGVVVGDGTVIMAGCSINSDTTIGEHCIINTSASIDHDNRIGNYVTIAPGAVTGGNVVIGDYSAVLLGAKVVNRIRIGEHSVVGAGSVVLRDIGDQLLWYGVPARFVRKRDIDEKYL